MSPATIHDPSKKEKFVFQIDDLSWAHTCRPGLEDIVLVSLSIRVARIIEVWGSGRLRKPSGWEREFLSF